MSTDMGVVFSVVIYVVAGAAALIWLVGQKKVGRGIAHRVAVILFWPAYLAVCSSSPQHRSEPALDGGFDALIAQIGRLPIGEARRDEYRASVARLGTALADRQRELERLASAEARVLGLGTRLGRPSEVSLVDVELSRVRSMRDVVEREIQTAREAVLRLVLRLEVMDVEGSRVALERELVSLEEELGRLLEARREAELVTSSP